MCSIITPCCVCILILIWFTPMQPNRRISPICWRTNNVNNRIVDDLLGLQPSEPSFVVPTSLRDFNETSPPAAAANEPHSTSRTSPSSTYTTVRSEYSSNTNTTSTTATQSSSVAKIIDIQKRPKLADRKTCRQAAFENETPTDEICQLQDERQNR